ncbi:hypothetical protein [Photobacterium andalusiense]|uniref:Uncharacterized protein n=1 Tax=Photobacterium andalusiense TaxID=2204296 RepID=A0A1Y6MKD4_9GAMM|nr:hypothetical protein [Photobacterium andalusiense]SMY36379.1 hypothetical protein PAND9192_02640 [Photobacterium andalusiense]
MRNNAQEKNENIQMMELVNITMEQINIMMVILLSSFCIFSHVPAEIVFCGCIKMLFLITRNRRPIRNTIKKVISYVKDVFNPKDK